MTVDISRIKPGDEVTVRAVVACQNNDLNWGLNFQHCNGYYDGSARHFVHPDAIVSHTPRGLAVGDVVKTRPWTCSRLTILCIHGKWAWLADDHGSTVQDLLDNLERVP